MVQDKMHLQVNCMGERILLLEEADKASVWVLSSSVVHNNFRLDFSSFKTSRVVL